MATNKSTTRSADSPPGANHLEGEACCDLPHKPTFPAACPFPACRQESVDRVEQAKQEWESTVDSLPQLICLLDAEGWILRANRTAERWGLGQVANIRGRNMHELLHPLCHDPHCMTKKFWETANTLTQFGKPAEYQTDDRFLRRSLQFSYQCNHPRHALHSKIQNVYGIAVVADISELKDAERNLQTLNQELERRIEARTFDLVTTNLRLKQEIEDRKRIEAELEKSREEYRLLVDNMSEGLLVCDKSGGITYINDRLSEMLARPREEIVGRPASEFIEASSRPVWNEQVRKIQTGTRTSHELKLLGHKQAAVWAKVSPSPLLDPDGKIIGSFAVVTDISDRVAMEEALRASKNRLSLLSEQVIYAQEKERQRVAGELHDGIGQTLSAVKFCVESGIRCLQESPTMESLQQMEAVIPRIQDAIEEVRRISMALRPSILDDIGIIATLTWFCRESSRVYAQPNIQLRLNIEEEQIPVPIKVVIFRIVQEALNNVIKHSQARQMQIALRHTGSSIELEIEDNGIGFDTRQFCPSTGRKPGGLGLVSMRERAELSGATCTLHSAPGKGTRIAISWPVVSRGQ